MELSLYMYVWSYYVFKSTTCSTQDHIFCLAPLPISHYNEGIQAIGLVNSHQHELTKIDSIVSLACGACIHLGLRRSDHIWRHDDIIEVTPRFVVLFDAHHNKYDVCVCISLSYVARKGTSIIINYNEAIHQHTIHNK